MGCVTTTSDAAFDLDVVQDAGPVLVDFYTPTCPPCRQVAPVLEELCNAKQGSLKIVKIDASENPVVASNHQIHVVPTFVLYKAGKLVGQVTGARSKDWFENWITTSLAG